MLRRPLFPAALLLLLPPLLLACGEKEEPKGDEGGGAEGEDGAGEPAARDGVDGFGTFFSGKPAACTTVCWR